MRIPSHGSLHLRQQYNHSQEVGSRHTEDRFSIWRHSRHHRRCWSAWPSFGRCPWRYWIWQLGRSWGGCDQTTVSFFRVIVDLKSHDFNQAGSQLPCIQGTRSAHSQFSEDNWQWRFQWTFYVLCSGNAHILAVFLVWSSVSSFRKVQLVHAGKMSHGSRQLSQAGWTQPSQIHQESIPTTAQVVAFIMMWQGNSCVRLNMIGTTMSEFRFFSGWPLTKIPSKGFVRSFALFRQSTITLATFFFTVSTPTLREMYANQRRVFWKVRFLSRWVLFWS